MNEHQKGFLFQSQKDVNTHIFQFQIHQHLFQFGLVCLSDKNGRFGIKIG